MLWCKKRNQYYRHTNSVMVSNENCNPVLKNIKFGGQYTRHSKFVCNINKGCLNCITLKLIIYLNVISFVLKVIKDVKRLNVATATPLCSTPTPL